MTASSRALLIVAVLVSVVVTSRTRVCEVPTSSQVDTLQFVGNGMLAAGTYDDLTIFDTRDHTIARQLAARSQMSLGSMTISPDGTRMVVTRLLGTGGTSLWDVESNSPVRALLPGKGKLRVRFASGATLVSWGKDRTMDHGRDPLGLQDPPRRIRNLVVAEDGSSVVAAAVDEKMELEHLAGELRKASEQLGKTK
jgi:WD40 repeat protein